MKYIYCINCGKQLEKLNTGSTFYTWCDCGIEYQEDENNGTMLVQMELSKLAKMLTESGADNLQAQRYINVGGAE